MKKFEDGLARQEEKRLRADKARKASPVRQISRQEAKEYVFLKMDSSLRTSTTKS